MLEKKGSSQLKNPAISSTKASLPASCYGASAFCDVNQIVDVVKKKSRVIAIIVAFLGLTITGIVIAVAIHAATAALANHR